MFFGAGLPSPYHGRSATSMFTLPNLLSLSRFPLALLFMEGSLPVRAVALLLAALSDGLDGFLARRYRLSSQVGTILDPLMDKFFVLVVLFVFLEEGKLNSYEALALLGRDLAVLFFGCYLTLRGTLLSYQVRPIWSGKVATALQFLLFFALLYAFSIPAIAYWLFAALGIASLLELIVMHALCPSPP